MSTLEIFILGFGAGYLIGAGVAVFVAFWIVLRPTPPTTRGAA